MLVSRCMPPILGSYVSRRLIGVSGMWITPPWGVMTRERVFAIPRRDFAPGLCSFASLSKERAQGMPGARCTRGLVCQTVRRKAHTSIQVSGNTPTSPAQRLYGLLRALPGGAGLLSPSPLRSLLLTSLAPASRRQDHTTSPYAADPASPKGFAGLPPFAYGVLRPSHPAPHVS